METVYALDPLQARGSRPHTHGHPPNPQIVQTQAPIFYPASMDRCVVEGCSHLPGHSRSAHQRSDFPTMLYGDQGGDPTLGSDPDTACLFDSKQVSSVAHGTSGWNHFGSSTAVPSFSFRPLDPTYTSLPNTGLPLSVLSPSTVQAGQQSSYRPLYFRPDHVDASKYKTIDETEWYSLEGSSPSSIDTYNDEPLTPTTPRAAGTFPGLPDHGHMNRTTSDNAAEQEASGPMNLATAALSRLYHTTYVPCHSHPFNHSGNQTVSWPQVLKTVQDHYALNATFNPFLQYNGMRSDAHDLVSRTESPEHGVRRPGAAVSAMHQDSFSTAMEEDVHETSDTEHYTPAQPIPGDGSRRDRDAFLLACREQGMSYKEIKARGRLPEAESTLRGRIRVLTKHKDERVRRPEWQANDIHLLRRAVRVFSSRNNRGNDGRFPWKKISTWMKSHGSSYGFAPATCAKKWRSLT